MVAGAELCNAPAAESGVTRRTLSSNRGLYITSRVEALYLVSNDYLNLQLPSPSLSS